MAKASPYQIIIHQFTNGPTGHVNVEFVRNGISYGTFGANIDPDGKLLPLTGGVYNETGKNIARIADDPKSHSQEVFYTDIKGFSVAYSYTKEMLNSRINGTGDYDALCGNCVDFANEVLVRAGETHGVVDYLKDGTLVKFYAETSRFLCVNQYDPLMDSNHNQFSYYPSDEAKEFFFDNYGYMPFFTGDWIMMFDDLQHYYFGNSLYNDDLLGLTTSYAMFGSPVVIDLNGDGVQTVSKENGVLFDIDSDGLLEKTGWIDNKDGFLALDANGNGRIDDVNEMFGGIHFGDGYKKLFSLDENNDGVLNSLDTNFRKLSVWIDTNSNGTCEKTEVYSLPDLGIQKIILANEVSGAISNGNIIGETSYVEINGSISAMADVYFQYEKTEQHNADLIIV